MKEKARKRNGKENWTDMGLKRSQNMVRVLKTKKTKNTKKYSPN